jgi:small-conductance mechanosensitive channel/CRP-like cAMP-binding protein
MFWPIAAIAVLLGAELWGARSIRAHLPPPYGDVVVHVIAVALIVVVFLLLDGLIRRFYWHGYVRRRTGREAPALLRDMMTVALVLLGLSIGLSIFEGFSITGLVTASGATAIILGIALQAVIQDMFSGLAINLDGAYAIGDYLTIYSDQMPEPVYGCVVSISWRSTFIALDDGRRLMLPNHMATANPVMNHSRPREPKRLAVEITIDNRVPADRVIDMLLGEAFKASRQPGLSRLPEPSVMLARLSGDAAVYEVRFFAHPDQIEPGMARATMLRALLDIVQLANLPMPVTQVEMSAKPDLQAVPGKEEITAAIARADLFSNVLNDEHIVTLMEHSIVHEWPAGTELMKQDDPPSSAFLMLEGAASVTLRGPEGGTSQEAAILATGNVVGEMSLMTGAPRSATVTALTRVRVLEIPKDAIEAILRDSPELAERFSRALVERQRQNQDLVQRAQRRAAAETDLLARMKTFFSRAFGASGQ